MSELSTLINIKFGSERLNRKYLYDYFLLLLINNKNFLEFLNYL